MRWFCFMIQASAHQFWLDFLLFGRHLLYPQEREFFSKSKIYEIILRFPAWKLEGHALFSHKAQNPKENKMHNDHKLHCSGVNKTWWLSKLTIFISGYDARDAKKRLNGVVWNLEDNVIKNRVQMTIRSNPSDPESVLLFAWSEHTAKCRRVGPSRILYLGHSERVLALF